MAKKTFGKPLKSAHRGQKPPNSPVNGKDRALAALIESNTVAAAARNAEVGESTLRRWLREDGDFQQKLSQQRQEALGHVALRLQQRASEAVEALFDSIHSEKKVEPGRAAMVRTALDFAFRAGAYNDLAGRLEELERVAKEDRENPSPANKPRHPQTFEDEATQDETDQAAAVNGQAKASLH